MRQVGALDNIEKNGIFFPAWDKVQLVTAAAGIPSLALQRLAEYNNMHRARSGRFSNPISVGIRHGGDPIATLFDRYLHEMNRSA